MNKKTKRKPSRPSGGSPRRGSARCQPGGRQPHVPLADQQRGVRCRGWEITELGWSIAETKESAAGEGNA